MTTSSTNRAFSHEVTTSESPDRVSTLRTDGIDLEDVGQSPKNAELADPIALGARGKVMPVSGPVANVAFTQFKPKTSYTFVSLSAVPRMDEFICNKPTTSIAVLERRSPKVETRADVHFREMAEAA